MLMLLCRTTRLVGTVRSNDNINSNAKNYSDCRDRYCIGKTSARQGWDRFWHIRKGSFGAFFFFFVVCIIVISIKITRSVCLQS